MKKYTVKTPRLVSWIYPSRTWALSREQPHVYLTFDDGPIPQVTPWVLDQLKAHNAKATFFCIGDNIRKHPEIYRSILEQGHSVGNHTFHHKNGRETSAADYLNEVQLAEAVMEATASFPSHKLFRPPYGRLTAAQSKGVQAMGYEVVMWDILSADFDPRISPEQCSKNVTKHLRPGSIVVFHDSLKAEAALRQALPATLDLIDKKGWKCQALRPETV